MSAFFLSLALLVGGIVAPDIPVGTPTVVAIEEIIQGIYQ